MIYRNPEYYQDPTAGQALENLEREGWEYNKTRYKALLRESADMIEKMKRSGTWPTKKPKPKSKEAKSMTAPTSGDPKGERGAFAPPLPVADEGGTNVDKRKAPL